MTQPGAALGAVSAVQRGLEALYRVETHLDVNDFLVTTEQRGALYPGRQPREQLLLSEHDDGMDIALYLDEADLRTLARHDPRQGVDGRNLQALLLVVEGVSHFIYVVHHVRAGQPLSALEMELQAEVDKYVALVLLTWDAPMRSEALIDKLFQQVRYLPDLSAEEQVRYVAANGAAAAYAVRLTQLYLARRALLGFLTDVRRFWRMTCAAKLSHISQSGA